MYKAWNSALSFLILGFSAALPGCEAGLFDPEGKQCSQDGECLSGYECDTARNVCVKAGSLTSSGDTTTETSGGGTTNTGGAGGTSSGGGGTITTSGTGGTTSTGGSGGVGGQGGNGGTGGSGGVGGEGGQGGTGGGCAPDQMECGPLGCISTLSDVSHCGDCDTVCSAQPLSGDATGDPSCEQGMCDVTCAAGLTECTVGQGNACVDVQKDPQYCGSCNTKCGPGTNCAGATCVGVCPPGLTKCGNDCVNLLTDPRHCGQCDNGCPELGLPPESRCSLGFCETACDAGLTVCSPPGLSTKKSCSNIMKDPANCGACNTKCSNGQLCINSACTTFVYASGCWECGGATPTCCQTGGVTTCVAGGACPN